MATTDSSEIPEREPRFVPFRFTKRLIEFQSAFEKLLAARLREMQISVISRDNIFGYTHGTQWRTSPTNEGDDTAHMTQQIVETRVPFESIANGDLSAMDRHVQDILDQFMKAFMSMMYQTVSAATEKIGNVVNSKGAGFKAEHFIEMLEKIEFGVDKNGLVTLPQIHASPSMAEAMLKELSSQGPTFEARIEAIKQKKTARAIELEKERKAKFPKRPGT